MRKFWPQLIWLAAGLVPGAWSAHGVEGLSDSDLEFFEKRVRPVLVERCYECHSKETGKEKGGLLVDSRDALARGGDSGAALKPGNPEASLLIEAVRYHNRDMQMPPKGALPKAEVAVLERWISMGAPDPREEKVAEVVVGHTKDREAARRHWSFQPLSRPAIPAATGGGGNGVDAFIQQKLAERQLTASREADRRTLLRRVSYDLTGLPPSPQELDDFLNDERDDAYERVVDRLLDSPQYGERWGRHWLDVARYADSNGLDENIAFGTAWRYRDYVVKAFNDDKPFDVFLTEQLAGDLMSSPDLATRHERATATAFLNLGAKVLAEPDKEKLVMDIVDEQIDTVGKVFLGLTLGCARCHEHKFDPILQEDYYALAAVFKSTQTITPEKKGAISQWNETPIAGLDEFARVHAAEQRLTEVKKQLTAAETKAKTAVELEARANAAAYLVAAMKLPAQVTLTGTKALAKPLGLQGAILLNCHVYLRTHADDAFFQIWREAANTGDEAKILSHYGRLFELAVPKAGQDEAAEVAEARLRLQSKTGFLALPPVPDSLYPQETLQAILVLRDEADLVEKQLPDLPTVISVADSQTILKELRLHIRGSHLALGEPVPRGVPQVMKVAMKGREPVFPKAQSGRLELARWLTDKENPLTARVMVNRVWTWHFGQGLVGTPDNFGVLGALPTHPELLDWLARKFVSDGWSVKSLHRLILNSATYRQQSAAHGPAEDLENQLLSVFPIRRLEAEEIRDTLLSVAGLLDMTAGGKTVPLRNRQFVFNHTSKDATVYDSHRRALYLPVIRNHLYELFQQFDYPDPSMPTGQRASSVVAPQALIMMNSPLMTEVAAALAGDDRGSGFDLNAIYERLYGRAPTQRELERCRDFLRVYEAELASRVPDADSRPFEARAALCQSLLMADELIFLR